MKAGKNNIEKLDSLFEKAEREIEEKNTRKLFDINKQWEKVVLFILNIAYDWNLEDLNLIHPNYPGIDLGDHERHIGVQVSTDSTPAKIKKTLKTIQNTEINGRLISDDYNIIYFFIPGRKQKSYRVTFELEKNIIFTTENIIDFDIFRNIFSNLNDEKQKTILAILNRELCKKPKYQLSATPTTNCDFIVGSRQKEIEEIDEKFTKSNQVFLWGLGGIGKTELAVEWGMRRDDVYLVHYKKSIMNTVLDMDFSGMQYIPSKQGMTEQQKKEEEFCQRLDILREYYCNATIIIDNFDDSKMTIAEMLNQPDYKSLIRLKNRFLFTTRFMIRNSSIHVTEMNIEDLLKLVKQNYNIFVDNIWNESQLERINRDKNDEILKELIRKVDGHTLTVDVMSKTLYESCGRLTPEKLLATFEENNIDDSSMPMVAAYHNCNDSDYELQERSIYDHLRILFNLSELDDIHKNVMRHAVLLPMEGMPMNLFRICHTLEEQNAIEMKIFHRSWLKLDQTHTTVSIHSVIREVCRRELKPDDENCKRFLHKLRNSIDFSHDNQEIVTPIADTMGNAAETLPDIMGEWNRLAGDYYRLLGMYRKAIDYLKKAALIRKNYNDKVLEDIYSNIGNTYTHLGEFETSIIYHKKSLALCQSRAEPYNKRIARRYNDMGLAYSYRAEKERAIVLYEKAIACYQAALGLNRIEDSSNELHISNILNNIGNTYSNIGKTSHDLKNYNLALQYHLEAKKMREAIHNISPRNLARSYKNIGNDYANLNMNDEALAYRIKALGIYEKMLHGGHPELANAYQDVGNSCRLTENYDEALKYYTKAEIIWKKQLPQNYFFLAKCQYAIGMIYSEQGLKGESEKYKKALEYYMTAFEGYKKSPRECEEEMIKCRELIGDTFLKLGKGGEAFKYLKGENDICFSNSKKSKYKQIKKYHHLGEISKKEKQFEEALKYYYQILEIRENYYSNDFENLMETYFEIACIYRDLRLPQNAMLYLEKAFIICEKYFQEDKKKLHRIRKTIEITNGELKKINRKKENRNGKYHES